MIDDLVGVVRQLTFLEAGHELLETIQQTCSDRRARGNDVDLLEEGQPREKGEIRRPQPR